MIEALSQTKGKSLDRLAGLLLRGAFRNYHGTMVFLLLGLSFCPNVYARPKSLVLQNRTLAVRLESSDTGPRLASIDYKPTNDSYIFSDSQEVSLAVLRPQVIHDPKTKVDYELQRNFSFGDAVVAKDKKSVVFHFLHDLVRVEVHYELQSDAPVLHKTITCKARKSGAYVAGVRQWMLKPVNMGLAWPTKSGTFGQPAVLLKPASGCLITLEWPRQQVLSDERGIRIEYRPGYQLIDRESKEVGTGSMVFFSKQANEQKTSLETTRRVFFKHIAARTKPNVPSPVKFTPWGSWLSDVRADRFLEIMDDMQYVGAKLINITAGWQWADRPYSMRLPAVQDSDDKTWDLAMSQPERYPEGVLPVIRAAKKRGIAPVLYFATLGTPYVRESPETAILDKAGKPRSRGMAGVYPWPDGTIQASTSEYGKRLKNCTLQALERYDLAGIHFDFHFYSPDFATDHESLANSWDSIDVQLRKILEIYDEAENRRPGFYRFYNNANSWPWVLKHATHIHAGDPGTSGDMKEAIKTDYPARALAYERRLAWQRHYDNFVPPWGVKGDMAGWSMQQQSPIPVNLEHTGLLIPSGEGWTQSMFTCFATTAVRDIRFSFAQMPQFDKDILREWLAWDRKHTKFVLNCRPLFRPSNKPNEGIMAYSHVGSGEGVIYLFNSLFDLAKAEVFLDESAGFRPIDKNLSASMVYPMRAPLGSGKISYGDTLNVPIIGKDCVVIEVGLETPKNLDSYAKYEQVSSSVKRSFKPLYLTAPEEVFRASESGFISVEVGESPRDRRLASQILEVVGAKIGRRLTLEECLALPLTEAKCRLIIGTNEGLSGNAKIGDRFSQPLYNQYVRWDNNLISAPLVAELSGADIPTYCLIAPRPEQLAELAKELASSFSSRQQRYWAKQQNDISPELFFSVTVPSSGKPVLSFEPVIGWQGKPLSADLELIRFEVYASHDGKRELLWSEDVPPFLRWGEPWWRGRFVPLADLAGKNVTFHLKSGFVDKRLGVKMTVGFRRVSVLGKED